MLLIHHSYVMKTQILNNAHVLGQNNMAANVLILYGMTRQGVYSLMSLLLFYFYIHPLDSVTAANLGQTHYTVTVQVLPLVKCREHIRALRSDAESLRPIAAKKPFLRLCDNSNSYSPLWVLTFGILYTLVPLATIELVKHWSTTQTPISAEHQYGGHDNVITFT